MVSVRPADTQSLVPNTFGGTSERERGELTDVMNSEKLTVERRTVLRATGAAIGGAALAGCTGSATDTTDSPAGDAGGESGGETAATDDGSDETAGASGGGSSPEFDGWLSDVGNYDGVTDATGEDSVTVRVGTEANGGAYGFGPAAVRVDAGTTVVWKWTGDGGSHNVVAEGGEFESEMVGEKGHTFEHAFESAGTYEYACTPHEAMGMKGVVVVE
jgi:halocyanin-like protein